MNANVDSPFSPVPWRLWLLASLGVLSVLAVVLFHPIENWRGKRAWENCQHELAARGESLDWRTFIPPPVPDAQNFFKAPRMTEWFVGRETNELFLRLGSDRLESFSRYRDAGSNVVVVAELTFSSATHLDLSRFDGVVRSISGGGLFFARCNLPVRNAVPLTPGSQTNVIPLILMEEVPLVEAIKALAREARLNFSFDQEILLEKPDSKDPPAPPLINMRWENITAQQALLDLLDHYGLQCIEDPQSRGVRITPKIPAVSLAHGFPDLATQMGDLLRNALGKSARAAQGFTLIPGTPGQIKPARILASWPSDEPPSLEKIRELFRTNPVASLAPDTSDLRIEHMGNNSFRVALARPQVYTTGDYLAWSDQFEADFLAIHNALQRPYARMDGDYDQFFTVPIPNFKTVRSVSFTLMQRAQCHLLLDQPEPALRELTLVHDLCRMLEGKPTGKPMTMVAAMIDVAVTGLYADTVADGLRLHAWREPQLAAIQEQLGQINLPPLLAEGMRTERTGLCRTIQIELAARAKNGSRNPEAGVWQKVFNPDSRRWPLMPRGWFDQNLVTIAELGQKRIDSLDLTNHLVMVKRVNAWEKEVKRLGDHFRPYSWVAAIASPNFARAFQTVAENQTRADEALIACALERYRLAYGQYPETLAALAPQFLKKIPGDIINGQPLKYRRTADGQFALYSIGWDETDDDGSPALKRFGSMEPAKGDWVWVSAAN